MYTIEKAKKLIEDKIGVKRNYIIVVEDHNTGGSYLFVHDGSTGEEYPEDHSMIEFYAEEGYILGAHAYERKRRKTKVA